MDDPSSGSEPEIIDLTSYSDEFDEEEEERETDVEWVDPSDRHIDAVRATTSNSLSVSEIPASLSKQVASPNTCDSDYDTDKVLRLYSCFADSYQGSDRMALEMETIASWTSSSSSSSSNMPFRALEFHAFYLPPSDLPLLSFGRLLQQSGPFLQRLELIHLRLTTQYSTQFLPHLVLTALGSLKCLEHLTWDPLPACLWWWQRRRPQQPQLQQSQQQQSNRITIQTGNADNEMYDNPNIGGQLLLHALAQLPALQHLHFCMNDPSDCFSEAAFAVQDEQPQERAQEHHHHHHQPMTLLSSRHMFPPLMKSLEHLQLTNMTLTNDVCHLLALGLQDNHVESCTGSPNSPSSTSVLHSSNSSVKLRYLDLSSGCFVGGIRGCQMLVQALRHNQTLQSLNLLHCQFKTKTQSTTSSSSSSSSHSSPSLPIRTQFLEALRLVLEESNTSLQEVVLVSHVHHPNHRGRYHHHRQSHHQHLVHQPQQDPRPRQVPIQQEHQPHELRSWTTANHATELSSPFSSRCSIEPSYATADKMLSSATTPSRSCDTMARRRQQQQQRRALPSLSSPSIFQKLQFLLSLNQSRVRTQPMMLASGGKGNGNGNGNADHLALTSLAIWPYLLEQTSVHSPTVTYQLLHQHAHSFVWSLGHHGSCGSG